MQTRWILVATIILFSMVSVKSGLADLMSPTLIPSLSLECAINQSFLNSDFCASYNCTIENQSSYNYLLIKSDPSKHDWEIRESANKLVIVDFGLYRDAGAYWGIVEGLCPEDVSALFDRVNASPSRQGITALLYSESLLSQSEADKNDFSKCSYKEYERVGSWLLETNVNKPVCSSIVITWILLVPAMVFAGIPFFLSLLVGGTWAPCGFLSFYIGLVYVYLLSCLFIWLRTRKKRKIGYLRFLANPGRMEIPIFILVFIIFAFSLSAILGAFGFCVMYAL